MSGTRVPPSGTRREVRTAGGARWRRRCLPCMLLIPSLTLLSFSLLPSPPPTLKGGGRLPRWLVREESAAGVCVWVYVCGVSWSVEECRPVGPGGVVYSKNRTYKYKYKLHSTSRSTKTPFASH